MLLHHNTLSAVLLIIVTATHHAAGVQINSVGLKTELPYVRRDFPAHIKFNLTMEPEESLQSVVWQNDDGKSHYEWQASGTVIVSGILLGAINITAPNGELVFPQVQLDYAGNYNLTVFTSNGNDTTTYKLIVYDSSFVFSFPMQTSENCTWPVQMTVFRVAPCPNISCVFEDGIGGAPSVPLDAIAEVEPNITKNENGTFNYEVAPNIPILRVPVDSWMSWQLWIEEFSVPLIKLKPSITAEPCLEPDRKVNLNYTFISFPYKSCYGGYLQGTRVSYFCTDNPDLEPHKTLRCISGTRWIETDTTPWPKCNTPPEPTSTEATSTDNSGSPLTFHRILLTATFLIASYCAMM